jgi:hypothetical protein
MDLAGGDRMGSKKYVASEAKLSMSPDTDQQPETMTVGFNFIAE